MLTGLGRRDRPEPCRSPPNPSQQPLGRTLASFAVKRCCFFRFPDHPMVRSPDPRGATPAFIPLCPKVVPIDPKVVPIGTSQSVPTLSQSSQPHRCASNLPIPWGHPSPSSPNLKDLGHGIPKATRRVWLKPVASSFFRLSKSFPKYQTNYRVLSSPEQITLAYHLFAPGSNSEIDQCRSWPFVPSNVRDPYRHPNSDGRPPAVLYRIGYLLCRYPVTPIFRYADHPICPSPDLQILLG